MAEQTFTPDGKSKITPEELAARCKLAKEAYARNRRIKVSWRIAAHALQSWPPRDPLELRRLALSRARFKLQTAAAPSPAAKVAPKAKAAPLTLQNLAGVDPRAQRRPSLPPTTEEIGHAIVAGAAAAADARVREVLASHDGLPPAATIELASPIKTVRITLGGVTVLMLASGQRITLLPAPADQGGQG